MPFSFFDERPIQVQKMGMRQHEAILAPHVEVVKAVMKKHKWTCWVCGVRIENYMQIDHIRGHGNSSQDALRPICAFCHDQDHMLWAAARKRVFPILAPDLSPPQISRISWAVASLRNAENEDSRVEEAIDNVYASFRKRREDFKDKYGAFDADSAIEGGYRFIHKDQDDDEAFSAEKRRILDTYASEMRFAPAFMSGDAKDPASLVSVWRNNGFKLADVSPEKAIGLSGNVSDLLSAVKSVL